MGIGQRLSLIFAVMLLPICPAAAQTLPWPTDTPRAASPAPWPSQGAPAASPVPAPGMSSMGAGPPPQASPLGGGQMPPCMAEFAKLREEVQKKGLAAKAAGQRKVAREEMCKHITVYSAAELKWVKYAESNIQSCGIPVQIVNQLKEVHGHTEQTKEKICAAGPQAGPPSLSDALGTSRLATPETTKGGSGTLDTLTGNAIQR
ncbi:MAG TPA: hypothetical protein VKP67_05725 [Xanthobacteraceae bacterium]|nr:hypothetical protein [Xanthobacteraceae bacterium]